MHVNEKFFVAEELFAPGDEIHVLHLLEPLAREVEPGSLNVFAVKLPADGCFDALGGAVRAVHNPPEHARVFAESWPQEFAVIVCGTSSHGSAVSTRAVRLRWTMKLTLITTR